MKNSNMQLSQQNQATKIWTGSEQWRSVQSVLPYLPVYYYYHYYLVCEAIDTAATPGLLCQPRVIVKMIVEKQKECRFAGETEVLLGENLPQRHFCPSQNPT
jgi:hypothetical protein